MLQPTTPGVYVVEKNAFPNSVVEVATAIPAFIGYTQQAAYGGKDLTNIPTRVESLKEFQTFFGLGFGQTFKLIAQAAAGGAPAGSAPAPAGGPPDASGGATATTGGEATTAGSGAAAPSSGGAIAAAGTLVSPSTIKLPSNNTSYSLVPSSDTLYYLYNCINLFYLNGGSTCYIVSIGTYDGSPSKPEDFESAINSLEYEQDPTMLLCPDALRLGRDDYNNIMQQMLLHCNTVQSRVALFDVYDGSITDPNLLDTNSPIDPFRDGIGQNYLNYGVAYFPWVNASVVSASDVNFTNLEADSLTILRDVLNPAGGKNEAKVPQLLSPPDPTKTENIFDQAIKLLAPDKLTPPLTDPVVIAAKRSLINNSLQALYPGDYGMVISAITQYLNVLPVSPAMAGVYTAVDNNRGVWKAPANVSLNAVVSPTVSLNDTKQSNLNVDAVSGKSINAIRAFRGLGVMVWGARTLDGNSQDWRYVNVRRTLIMIEQSVKLACHAYVFEPNDANTWTTVKSMINSFLFNLWKQGGLAGAVPTDAYSVAVGLGTTMTADDILNGFLNVTVLVALERPAEFIVLTFQQEMQKS